MSESDLDLDPPKGSHPEDLVPPSPPPVVVDEEDEEVWRKEVNIKYSLNHHIRASLTHKQIEEALKSGMISPKESSE
jgi:hypothetical protein